MKEHTGFGRVIAIAVRFVGAAVGICVACGCGPKPAARPSIGEIVAIVQRAVDAAAPGATLVGPAPGAVQLEATSSAPRPDLNNYSERMPTDGWSTANDGSAFCAHSEVRRFDWTKAIAAAQRGVPEVAIAHAESQAVVLAEAGFMALDAGATVFRGNQRRDEEFSWSVTRPMGGSGAVLASHPVRLVHRRIYFAPGTSAFVLTRTEYEAATGLATAEIACVEGYPRWAADTPSGRVPVRETLLPLPKR